MTWRDRMNEQGSWQEWGRSPLRWGITSQLTRHGGRRAAFAVVTRGTGALFTVPLPRSWPVPTEMTN